MNVYDAKSITFDSDVDTSTLSDASKMFANLPYLKGLTLPAYFGYNIKNASDMFDNDQPLYLRDASDNYTQSTPMLVSSDGTPTDSKNLGGIWTATPNPRPKTGTYAGVNYIDHGDGNIEFTSGIMQNGARFGKLSTAPDVIKNAKSMTFDKNVITNNVTDATGMFSMGDNLRTLSLQGDFGKNISNANVMFYGDTNLNTLSLPNDFGQSITSDSDAFGIFWNDKPLYLKDTNDNYTQSSPLSVNYMGTPINLHNLGGEWVATPNPRPNTSADFNVSAASSADNAAQSALSNVKSVYTSAANTSSSNDNYNLLYNDYYNASYAANAAQELADNSSVEANATAQADIDNDLEIANGALSQIENDMMSSQQIDSRNDDNLELMAHNAWLGANYIAYNVEHGFSF